MPSSSTMGRSDLMLQLPRMVGVHRWSLNLQTETMRLEYGRDPQRVELFETTVTRLSALLGPGDMKNYLDHWQQAIEKGSAGPVIMPFLKADGTKSIVESACCLHVAPTGERMLVGVFKRLATPDHPTRNQRVLANFLECFIENSPSGIVVADRQGNIVSVNREFMRFVGKLEKSELIQHPVLDAIYPINSGLGSVVRDALHAPKPSRGRYEFMYPNGLRQTLYWRVFPLSGD